jgi:hypothetical protein
MTCEYIKQIYAKNKHWDPEPAPSKVEDGITEFDKALHNVQETLNLKQQKINLRNLTYLQSKMLRILKESKHLTIKPTDKNLGPAIMDTDNYIKQVLQEHLLTKDYVQLSDVAAKTQMDNIKHKLKTLITASHRELSIPEQLYFQHSFQHHYRTPIFYGLPEVHKVPFTLRPVVSNSSSFFSLLSNWLDNKMKDLLPLVRSYIKNSTTILNNLCHTTLPETALLFSADATSMYTNIDMPTGVSAVRDFITINKEKLPADFPTDLFLQILTTVMENNIFKFVGTHWLQLSGTAMGTPAVCAYARISFGQYENQYLLPTLQPHLLYYKRYIDEFKAALNNWGKLKWVTEEPSSHTTFLDLNITIEGSSITTSTFQKAMNLYLYIPPQPSHPPCCFKGLIVSELKRYFIQNNKEDFEKILTKFIGRLLDRGHTLENLSPLLLQAATNIDRQPSLHTQEENGSTLYIHLPFHPKGIQRQTIRQLYNSMLKDIIPFEKMQVAISRPHNLRPPPPLTPRYLTHGSDLKNDSNNNIMSSSNIMHKH